MILEIYILKIEQKKKIPKIKVNIFKVESVLIKPNLWKKQILILRLHYQPSSNISQYKISKYREYWREMILFQSEWKTLKKTWSDEMKNLCWVSVIFRHGIEKANHDFENKN